VHITNGWRTHHRRDEPPHGPAITIDLNPTVPKIVGDALLEPVVIGVAVVVTHDMIATRPRPVAFYSIPRPVTAPSPGLSSISCHGPTKPEGFDYASLSTERS